MISHERTCNSRWRIPADESCLAECGSLEFCCVRIDRLLNQRYDISRDCGESAREKRRTCSNPSMLRSLLQLR